MSRAETPETAPLPIIAPDGSGPLHTRRGMEMGHIFQLGRKYAEALGLQVLDENGKLVTVTMGSYGIGVTRAVAAIAESVLSIRRAGADSVLTYWAAELGRWMKEGSL